MLVAPQLLASPKQAVQEREREPSRLPSPRLSIPLSWPQSPIGYTGYRKSRNGRRRITGDYWEVTILQSNSWICFMVLLEIFIFGKNFNKLKAN